MNLDQANLFAVFIEIIDGLFNGVADRAHGDNDLFGVARAIIVEKLIFGAKLCIDRLHIRFGDAHNLIVINIGGFSGLEENIGILCGTALHRMLRIERTAAESIDRVVIEQLVKVFVIPNRDLLYFMRGAEAIEEMKERHAALDRRQMRHSAQIHNLLRIIRAKHGISGLTAGVNI